MRLIVHCEATLPNTGSLDGPDVCEGFTPVPRRYYSCEDLFDNFYRLTRLAIVSFYGVEIVLATGRGVQLAIE